MRVTLGMKRIQTKLAITKTYHNSKKEESREDISDESSLYPISYNKLKCHNIYTKIQPIQS